MMPGPWDDRVLMAESSPTNRVARALEKAGQTVTDIRETGRAGKTMGSVYTYDCGCKRVYKVTMATMKEGEFLRACEAHTDLVNLLTGRSPEGTMGAKQEADPE